jgi:predicted outer membrane repeat protein
MKTTLLCCALLASSIAGQAPAAIYLVRPDGSGDFPTITDAVSAAAAGDIIELADGTFAGTGNRDVSYQGKAITIRSGSGNPSRCVIDCQGSSSQPHRAFLFENGEGALATLEGVTITNGWHWWGGAIHCQGSSVRARIIRCIFSGNTSYSSEGGGLCAEYNGAPWIEECVFVGNSAAYGGAISLTNGSGSPLASIVRCTIYANFASEGGGGVRT